MPAFDQVHTFIFDVDGVLTDGTLLLTEQGELLRTMNIRDGYAIRRALEAGLRICIITGGASQGVTERLRKLGVTDIYANIRDKVATYEEYLYTYDLESTGILYMGDDLPDYDVMTRAGIAACPADAAREILSIAQYISPVRGGHGCVRDVIEKVFLARGLSLMPL